MTGNVEEYLTWVLKILGLLAGVTVSCGIIGKVLRRPARYVYFHLFGEPIGEWFRIQVGTVIDEKLQVRNGGTTLPDMSDRLQQLADRTDSQHRENVLRLDSIESRLKGDAA